MAETSPILYGQCVTPKRRKYKVNPIEGDSPASGEDFQTYGPWNWGEGARKIQLSPGSSYCGSPEGPASAVGQEVHAPDSKRGRPRLDSITSLILEGANSESAIRCHICNRVFPREKSLQAHLRTHTGERPYICDFPDCAKAFAQSGQPKTHQRLHTGEKPFTCTVPGCKSRFTHANRHCTEHPWAALERDNNCTLQVTLLNNENGNEATIRWLKKYSKDRTRLHDRKLKQEFDQAEREVEQRENTRLDPKESEMQEQDKLLGALALIQLAQSSASQQSPLDLSVTCSSSV